MKAFDKIKEFFKKVVDFLKTSTGDKVVTISVIALIVVAAYAGSVGATKLSAAVMVFLGIVGVVYLVTKALKG